MFIGRDAESRRLDAAIADREPVVVVGPPGIGKSTLVQQVARRSGEMMVARGIATLDAVPFVLFRTRLDVDDALFPDVVADRLVALGPSVVVLDDLQWADPASLEVVEQLMGRLPMLATVRAGGTQADAVLDRLALAGFQRVDLPGLPVPDARRLARAANPSMPDDRLESLVRTAKGNPLLLTEMGHDRAHSPTLTAAMLERLDGLPEHAREAMYRLSVLGRPGSERVLGPGAEALVASGLAHRVDGRIEVHHALLGEVVVEQLGPEADAVRRRVAPLVSDYEAALLLARAGARAEAREHALRAAAAAASPRDRAEALVVAVNHAPDGDLDVENRFQLTQLLIDFNRAAEALHHSGLHLLDDADLSPPDRGRLTALAAYAHWLLGDTRRFATLIEDALSDLRGTRTDAEVRVLAASTIYATWVDLDGRSALDRATEAVELADEIGCARAFARMRLAAVTSTAGADGWAELYQQAMDLAEADGDPRVANEAATSLVLTQWTRGDAHAGRKVAVHQLERLSRADHPHSWLVHAASVAILDLMLGTDPGTIVETWQPLLREAQPFRTRPFLEAAVTIALAELGLDREAAESARGLIDRVGAAEQWQAVAHWVVAEVAWLGGRNADVAGAVDRVGALGIANYPPAVMARILGAHVEVEQGRPPPGAEPVALMPAWAASPVEWRALVAEHEERWTDAVALFDQAANLYADHDERSRARCSWAAARALQRSGADASDRLVAAEAFAERHNYRALVRRIHPLLRRAGVTRNAPGGRAPGGLTAREHEVLELVSHGRTSVQIAGELGISRDTVDDLVGSALRRLDVSNRRAAVAKLRTMQSTETGGRSGSGD